MADLSGAGAETYISMGWALVGSPKLKNIKYPNLRSFANFEKAMQDEGFAKELTGIALTYGKVVTDAFNRAHGRTGNTAKQSGVVPRRFGSAGAAALGGLPTLTLAVEFKGGIGFVVNPIRTHEILPRNAQYLTNFNSGQAEYNGKRQINFHSAFPNFGQVMRGVTWFQGGDESFSPDRTWFEEGAARDTLAVESAAAMSRMAQFSKVLWADEFSGFTVIAAGKTKFVPTL